MTGQSYFRRPEKLLRELGISRPEEIDVEAIAQYCGATVIYEDLRGCEARLLGFGNRAVISINQGSRRSRQRFSVAHELGHWMHDRGNASFACDVNAMWREWSAENPERLANQYAADLLLPPGMFGALAKDRAITFDTARDLANVFDTSLTATTIQLVRHGSFPAMVVCNNRQGRVWFLRGPDVPEILWPTDKPGPSTVAYDVLHGEPVPTGPTDVQASAWFERDDTTRYWIKEDVVQMGSDLVLSLLWWENEQQLLDLDAEDAGSGG
jgi:Zn-dependent peptidase ImmA (M78 family)